MKATGAKDVGDANEGEDSEEESFDFFQQPDPVDVMEVTAKKREKRAKCTCALFSTMPLLKSNAIDMLEPWNYYLNFM